MAKVSVVIVGKILEGALDGDMQKVRAYAQLAIDNLEKDGDFKGSELLRNKLDGSYKTAPKIVTLDSNLK